MQSHKIQKNLQKDEEEKFEALTKSQRKKTNYIFFEKP